MDDVRERCNAIEECYEFMLAFAAQGLPSDQGSGSGSQLREFLGRAVKALSGIAETYSTAIKQEGQAIEPYRAFLAVLDRDASDSIAAIEMVRAQPALSSQVIDNLNASIHLRALLTDLFLIDETFKLQQISGKPATTT
jgi:hypothetical protein